VRGGISPGTTLVQTVRAHQDKQCSMRVLETGKTPAPQSVLADV